MDNIFFFFFVHSEKLYGIYFSSTTVYLTSLFRKSYEISNILYGWIDDCIHFDFELDDDTNVLIKGKYLFLYWHVLNILLFKLFHLVLILALETLYSVGDIAVRLDIKTMVEQWKRLIKLTSKYACFLKNKLDISVPIQFLCSNLQKNIVTIMVEEVILFILYFN